MNIMYIILIATEKKTKFCQKFKSMTIDAASLQFEIYTLLQEWDCPTRFWTYSFFSSLNLLLLLTNGLKYFWFWFKFRRDYKLDYSSAKPEETVFELPLRRVGHPFFSKEHAFLHSFAFLLKIMLRSLHAFTFFTKERCVLFVLLCSL